MVEAAVIVMCCAARGKGAMAATAAAVGQLRILPDSCRLFSLLRLSQRRFEARAWLSRAATPHHPLAVLVRASAPTSVESSNLKLNGKTKPSMDVLACPICYSCFERKENGDSNVVSSSRGGAYCVNCRKAYSDKEAFLDLTVINDSNEFSESQPLFSEIFQSRLVSFLYERGWRQNFVWGGFPGPNKEFEMAKEYLQPTFGGVIIDASCASGLFSRRFAKSRLYSLVVALDYSENMLRQCDEFNKQEGILADESFILVRADISRLPFVTNTIDAVHAGAALHSWPSPSIAVAEISRVLRPGGVFVASTFILGESIPPQANSLLRQNVGRFFQYFSSERELEGLCRACGLVGFTCQRRGTFIMISATKPL
ncbi:uncharacterized methyltransferase At1g78140, chloroplastic-like [Nymphaea colorata]|nr:uncharacterized methyltransferase At1g78140, chloroplastic-like [Nymphaea colorata]